LQEESLIEIAIAWTVLGIVVAAYVFIKLGAMGAFDHSVLEAAETVASPEITGG